MNITFINGSPKAKGSASQAILNDLKTFLPSQNISEIHFNKPKVTEKQIETLKKSEILVFSFPLYVDSVPSNLLGCMIVLEKELQSLPITVYAICNNGFYEGIQNRPALKVIKNWSSKTKLNWGQGLGVGCGGMLAGLINVPAGKGPKKNLGVALKNLSEKISHCQPGENVFITANFPRFLYKIMAHIGWKKEIKKNGKKVKDLYLKL
ncbi:conserved hypothetical protein [uncultured Paludibacter sp.]|uniref:Uncharacterized protein n=1 Tax=uncultured Paludibacter sp. TaxID=497635 RepID=A0A653AF84_9BACT|nr:conserved hypothetical protein [uncultured Paludibacter sp.]